MKIVEAKGKLGILTPGMGAVSTTFIAGCIAVKKGLAKPIGSLSQMGSMETANGKKAISDVLSLAKLDDIVFGGWDLYDKTIYDVCVDSKVLDRYLIEQLKEELIQIRPMKAVFDQSYVSKLEGTHVKTGTSKMDLAEQVMKDIEQFKSTNNCERLAMVWCGSTEKYLQPSDVHSTLAKFEEGLRNSDPNIAPSMIYTYAALKMGIPYANGAPNLSCDIDAMLELADKTSTPIAGKDFKTGQTLMKTVVAPGLKARLLGVEGWFSTNILGNRDGEVLDDPANFKTKEVSKLGVLEQIFEPEANPELYGNMYHKVRINYYPPRGDNKEGWDNIDINGWLGYPMQIKIDFLCRDSILAAPIVLDLAIFLDLASRAGEKGVQEFLAFYLKFPQQNGKNKVVHDLFVQERNLYAKLAQFAG